MRVRCAHWVCATLTHLPLHEQLLVFEKKADALLARLSLGMGVRDRRHRCESRPTSHAHVMSVRLCDTSSHRYTSRQTSEQAFPGPYWLTAVSRSRPGPFPSRSIPSLPRPRYLPVLSFQAVVRSGDEYVIGTSPTVARWITSPLRKMLVAAHRKAYSACSDRSTGIRMCRVSLAIVESRR